MPMIVMIIPKSKLLKNYQSAFSSLKVLLTYLTTIVNRLPNTGNTMEIKIATKVGAFYSVVCNSNY